MGVALVRASQRNMIIDMCRLLTQGADVNYVHRWMHEGREESATLFTQAAVNGHADAVRVLISRGAEVSKREPCLGNTALHMAAQEGNVDVAICLLDHRADVNARDIRGFTPIAAAGDRQASSREGSCGGPSISQWYGPHSNSSQWSRSLISSFQPVPTSTI